MTTIAGRLVRGVSVEARGLRDELKAAGGARRVSALRAGRSPDEKALLVAELVGRDLAEHAHGDVSLTDHGRSAVLLASHHRWE